LIKRVPKHELIVSVHIAPLVADLDESSGIFGDAQT
jgi:hypothetical protein